MNQIPNTPRALKLRYPYMFQGEHIGHSFHRGWFRPFAETCMDIDSLLGADKRGFHWTQLKEKFGSASWYFRMDKYPGEEEEALRKRVFERIMKGSSETTKKCIICGAPGTIDDGDGWYLLALCSHHTDLRKIDPDSVREAHLSNDDHVE